MQAVDNLMDEEGLSLEEAVKLAFSQSKFLFETWLPEKSEEEDEESETEYESEEDSDQAE